VPQKRVARIPYEQIGLEKRITPVLCSGWWLTAASFCADKGASAARPDRAIGSTQLTTPAARARLRVGSFQHGLCEGIVKAAAVAVGAPLHRDRVAQKSAVPS
jgi:hypothetical protein